MRRASETKFECQKATSGTARIASLKEQISLERTHYNMLSKENIPTARSKRDSVLPFDTCLRLCRLTGSERM